MVDDPLAERTTPQVGGSIPTRSLTVSLIRCVDGDAFCPHETIETFVIANEAWAAVREEPLRYADVSSRDHRTWAIFVELSNELARRAPQAAHAVLVENDDGTHAVSVRAPLARPTGADRFCAEFEGGGGRAAAGGIDRIPGERLPEFLRRFGEYAESTGSPVATSVEGVCS